MKNKTKNKIHSIIAFVAIGLIGASCSNIFDQNAGNQISPDDHYKSTTDLEVSLAGVISPLQEAMPNLVLIDGLLSDQLTVTDNADGYMSDINEHIYSFDNPYLNTSDYYKVIINANEVLANLHKIAEIDPDFDEFYVTEVTNSLIGMRSWAYFTLVRLNGEAAWIDDNMTELPKDGLTYLPKEVILDSLINQLLPNLHLDENLAELNVHNYVNTKMLIGEIYLEKNDYANAVYYLKLAMESYGNDRKIYKVDKTFSKDAWYTIFLNAEGNITENIGVVPFNETEDQYNPVTRWTLPNDQYMVKPSVPLMTMYMDQKPTKGPQGDTYRGIGISVDTLASGEAYVKKYALDLAEPYGADIIISRAADAHLLMAEAYNRMGDHNTALIFVNDGWTNADKTLPEYSEYRLWRNNQGVRNRVTLSPRTVPSSITDEKQITEYIENIIMDERAMEMAFEGHRWFDLMRVARRRNDPEYLAAKVYDKLKYQDPDLAQSVKVKLRNPENWYIPLNK